MKKYHFLWLALPLSISLPFVFPGCAGTLTQEEKDALGGTGTTGGAAGSAAGGCAQPLFTRSCTTANCHGAEMPLFPDFILTADGIAKANNGQGFVGKKPNDVTADAGGSGLCGAGAGVSGKFIVDPNNSKASLMYDKLSATPSCGGHMPVVGKPATLSPTEQQCILDWIEALPGVTPGGGAGGSGGAGGAGAAGSAGSGGSGGAGGAGGSAGSGGGGMAGKAGGPVDAGKG